MTKHCRKPSHLQTKENQFLVTQIQDALWRKLNNTKPFLSRKKNFAFDVENGFKTKYRVLVAKQSIFKCAFATLET